MIAIKPITIDASAIALTSAQDAPAWSASVSYALGAQVSYQDGTYQSAAGGNLGNTPDASPTWWVRTGPRNTMAMFDASPSTATVGQPGQTLSVRIIPGRRISAIGLLAVDCASVRVRSFDGDQSVFDATRVMVSSDGTYYGWAFDELRSSSDALWTGMPASPLGKIQLDFVPRGGHAPRCGLCVLGRQVDVGAATWGFGQGVELRASGYIDANGNPVRIDRGWRKTINGTLEIPRDQYNRVADFLAQSVGIPMLWALDQNQLDYRSAVLFGDYERSVITLRDAAVNTVSIDINGYY